LRVFGAFVCVLISLRFFPLEQLFLALLLNFLPTLPVSSLSFLYALCLFISLSVFVSLPSLSFTLTTPPMQLIFVNTLHTGDFFGVGALRPGAGHVRAATIIATGGSNSTEEVRAMCLTRTGFDTFLSKFPGRRAGLMATIGQKMDHHLKTVPFLSGYGTSGNW
jgi:hypothetical protein